MYRCCLLGMNQLCCYTITTHMHRLWRPRQSPTSIHKEGAITYMKWTLHQGLSLTAAGRESVALNPQGGNLCTPARQSQH